MIFVTVGSNQPFDRLIQTVDAWAKAHPSVDVFAQIGSGDFEPSHLRYTRSMSPADFRAELEAAEIIVAHVGMGTIISALELGKLLVLMPRRVAYHEHTSDHQCDDLEWLRQREGLFVAMTERDFEGAMTKAMASLSSGGGGFLEGHAAQLASRIRQYILLGERS